jgi:hypothetical protein
MTSSGSIRKIGNVISGLILLQRPYRLPAAQSSGLMASTPDRTFLKPAYGAIKPDLRTPALTWIKAGDSRLAETLLRHSSKSSKK